MIIQNILKFNILILLLFALFPNTGLSQEDYIKLRVAIHCDSKISVGKYTIDELVSILDEQKLDAAFITDHDNMAAEYGIFPFQNILKYRYQRPSIHTYGFKNYLERIKYLDNLYPNLGFYPGIEAVPFYHWEGSLIQQNICLKNWHRHLLVLGMNNSTDFKKLPSILNKQYGSFSINKIIWGLIFLSGSMFCIFKFFYFRNRIKNFSKKRHGIDIIQNKVDVINKKRSIKKASKGGIKLPYSYRVSEKTKTQKKKLYFYRLLIVCGFIICIIGFLDNIPFRELKYSSYHKDYGIGPYQDLIDYVTHKGGLVFWAHPEVSNKTSLWKIKIETPSYAHLLMKAKNYTGFAIFWEGMKQVGRIGGIWDIILNQYW